MDNLQMIEVLGKATLFDLYRFKVMLSKMLEDPKRLHEVRMKLKPNQAITYFDEITNQEIAASIIKIGRTNALVRNHHDDKRWQIPFYMINGSGMTENVLPPTGKVDRLTIKVGERVGFVTKEGKSMYGIVNKLNQKTATIIVSENCRWRVSYFCLFYVIDGNIVSGSFLETEAYQETNVEN